MRVLAAAATIAAALVTAGSATAQQPGASPLGCSWWAGSNPDAVNIAYPDEGAAYWGTALARIPEAGLVIRGAFPHARYFSFHAYDPLLRPTGAILDRDIRPATGANRFADPANPDADGTYEIRILPGPPPAEPEPNTVYAGETFEGHPNPGGIVLYRVYVPDDPGDPTGGAGLPDVSLSIGDGAAEVPFGQCDITAALPDTGLNRAIREADYPDALPRIPPTRNETDPPRWAKFFGYATVLGLLPVDLPPEVVPGGGGFLSNVHNEYISTGINRSHADVVVIRGRMPTFPDTRAGELAASERQLRYWSICQNETYSQRFVACLADHEAVLDDAGRATIVISDPGDRPANATREHGVNWLPWGGLYPDGRVIYRQMVAAPGFGEAIARIEPGEDVEDAMGEYHPDIAYCPKDAFEAGGAGACLSP